MLSQTTEERVPGREWYLFTLPVLAEPIKPVGSVADGDHGDGGKSPFS